MARELGRVELRFGPHAELIAGVAGAAAHYAERAGLNASRRDGFTSAAEQACREAFPLLSGSETVLRVTMQCFADRVEISLEYRGDPLPAARIDRFTGPSAGNEGGPGSPGLPGHVDHVRSETRGDESSVTLISYLGKKPAGK